MPKDEELEEEMVEEMPEEQEDDEEDDEKLPFANARVVRLIKSQTGDQMIRSRVKEAMNELLGEICITISKKMADMPYAYLGYSEFKEAAAPYINIDLKTQEKRRLIAQLKKIKEEAAAMALELESQLSEDDRP